VQFRLSPRSNTAPGVCPSIPFSSEGRSGWYRVVPPSIGSQTKESFSDSVLSVSALSTLHKNAAFHAFSRNFTLFHGKNEKTLFKPASALARANLTNSDQFGRKIYLLNSHRHLLPIRGYPRLSAVIRAKIKNDTQRQSTAANDTSKNIKRPTAALAPAATCAARRTFQLQLPAPICSYLHEIVKIVGNWTRALTGTAGTRPAGRIKT
jgi:hypothetical protein